MKVILLPTIVLLGTAFSLFSQNRLYVNLSANGQANGQSWTDAFTSLHVALGTAQPGDSVWVSEGVYAPAVGVSRDSSFGLPSGVRLFGGFAGTESDISQRDWQSHPTVLSGDIGTVGDSTDNAYTILYLLNPDSGTVVDGLVFRHGIADNPESGPAASSPKKCGGAIYIMAANGWAYPDIQNCLFEYNYAFQSGGAVYVNGEGVGSVAPRFLNCTFRHNRARINGGGIYRNGSSWVERSPDFGGCVFEQNWANWRGGGLYFFDRERTDTMDIVDCTFLKNTVNIAEGGGAVFNLGRTDDGSKLVIKRCNFSQNTAPDGGAFGMINFNFLYTDLIFIDSSTFSQNSSQSHLILSGVLDFSFSKFITTNSSFAENYAGNRLITTEFVYGNSYFSNNDFIDNTTPAAIWTQTEVNAEVIIENNRVSNLTPIIAFQTRGVGYQLVRNNIFSAPSGTFVQGASFNGPPMIIENNRVVSKDGTFARFNNQSNAICRNNTVKAKTVVALYPGLQTANAWFDNTIIERTGTIQELIAYEGSDSKAYFANSLLDTTWYCDGISIVVCDSSNLYNLDPLFRDTANHDYSLLPCSPLLNKGSNAAASGILTDINGTPRIQEGTVDIGAYESPAFALAAAPAVLPACASDSNGSISVNPVFGCEPYDYQWLPPAGNGPELNGLPPGQYLLSITDASGRQILDTITVGQATAPVLSLVASDVQCGGQTGGSLLASVASGTAPFRYQWSPAAPDTAQLSKLSPGSYALTVVDANGCQDSAYASITLLGMLQPMIGGGTISCTGAADGWLSLTPATGAPPFTWLWDGWPGTDSIAQPLGPGNYSVTVTDAFGCTASNTFPPMNDPAPITATVGVTDQTDPDMPNGAAVVTTSSGGTPFPPPAAPYQYSWSNDEMGQFIAGLVAGEYTVTVTDQNGCTASVTVVVDLMVGTGDLEGSVLLMYPNPAADWVRVVLPAHQGLGNLRAELSDASGRVLRSDFAGALAGETGMLDLSGLAGGMYVLTLRDITGKAVFMGKIVKR